MGKKRGIGIACVAFTIVLLITLFSGRSAESTTKQALKAINNNKPSKFVSLMCDEAVEYQMEEKGLKTKKLLINEYEETFDTFQDEMKEKIGNKWKCDIKIIDSYDYEAPSYLDASVLEGKPLKEVAYEVTYKAKGLFNNKEETDSGTFLLVKEGNKWYIVNFK